MHDDTALFSNDSGATAVEYGLLAGLIALVAAGAVQLVGNGVSARWNEVDRAAERAAIGD